MKLISVVVLSVLVMSSFGSFSQIDCTGNVPDDYSGKCISHHSNGEISLIGKYKNGKKNGAFEGRYPTGEIQMKAKFKEDIPVDVMRTFYKNGKLSSKMVPGSPLSDMETYYENGNLKTSGKMGPTGLEGIWYTYNEQGILEDSTDFDVAEERELIELFEEEEIEYDPYQGNEQLRKKVDSLYEQSSGVSRVESIEMIEYPEVDAVFPSGIIGMQNFILENVWYPTEAIELGIQGVVYMSFLVETDGSISTIKVAKGVDKLLDTEGIRLILEMPKWKPALNQGKPVRSSCTVPIRFMLD